MHEMSWTEDVRERYSRGGLAGRLTPRGGLAVVVVDLQNGFTDPTCGPGFNLDEVVQGTRLLVDTARDADVPVVFTTIAFPEGADLVWLDKMPVLRELRAGSSWQEIDSRLDASRGEAVVVKQTASAFAGTDLADRLAAAGVGTVLICGATTSGCVRATAVDACAANLAVYVVEGCVGDREPGPHGAALLDLDAKYADVIGLEAALELVGSKPGSTDELGWVSVA